MSQIQCIVRETLAKASLSFVDEILEEAATQEALGNHSGARSLFEEALIAENFHRTRMALAA